MLPPLESLRKLHAHTILLMTAVHVRPAVRNIEKSGLGCRHPTASVMVVKHCYKQRWNVFAFRTVQKLMDGFARKRTNGLRRCSFQESTVL